jgi:tRNA threonylcarbamoyladenosine biosynthesis protein TsaE
VTLLRRTTSEAGTRGLGRALGRAMTPGSRLLLVGDLGAGKTALVRGVASGLEGGRAVRVKSPTYALCHVYPTTPRLWHADLYRITGAAELEALGVLDPVGPGDLLVVEWADRVPALLEDGVVVEIRVTGPAAREVAISARGALHHDVVDRLGRGQ